MVTKTPSLSWTRNFTTVSKDTVTGLCSKPDKFSKHLIHGKLISRLHSYLRICRYPKCSSITRHANKILWAFVFSLMHSTSCPCHHSDFTTVMSGEDYRSSSPVCSLLDLIFVDPCIIVQFIKKNSTKCNNDQNFIIPYLYEAQHVSGDTSPIIRSLKLHWQALVFQTREVVGRVDGGRCQAHCALQRPPTTCPTTFHVWKTIGCQCSFRLLMMGGMWPETCWASYKYGIIKFWSLLHLVGFFFMIWTMMHGFTNIKFQM